jgi:hypothetical protein
MQVFEISMLNVVVLIPERAVSQLVTAVDHLIAFCRK